MRPILPRLAAPLLAASALAALAGCDDPFSREPLAVIGLSGARVEMTGTMWELCRDDVPEPGQSQRYREVHGEDGAVTIAVSEYLGPGCPGQEPEAVRAGIAQAHGEIEVGWDGDPPGTLPARVAVTRVEIDSNAWSSRDVYLVDDTVAPRVLYTGAPGAPRDANGFPTLLLTSGAVER